MLVNENRTNDCDSDCPLHQPTWKPFGEVTDTDAKPEMALQLTLGLE